MSSVPKPPWIPTLPQLMTASEVTEAQDNFRDGVCAPYQVVGAQAVQAISDKLMALMEPDPEKRMRKLTRANLNAWKVRQLKVEQAGLCALCGKPVDLKEAREGAVDHNHDTGEVRGVLHRSCNAAEGKIANAAGAWGAKSMRYEDIVPFVEKLVAYWKRPGCGVIYPTHKSAEESANIKRNKRNQQAKERRAAQKAQRVLRDRKEVP